MESINGSLTRLGTDYVDLYQAHRYDYETPIEETFQAFADVVRQGKALYIGVSEWTAEQLREGHALAKELGIQLISNQPQYSMLWRVIEGKVVPASEELGISQIVWSPMAQGVLSGKYLPGQAAPGGLARDRREERRELHQALPRRRRARRPCSGSSPSPSRRASRCRSSRSRGCCRTRTSPPRWSGHRARSSSRDTFRPPGVKLDADTMAAIDAALGDAPITDAEETYTVSPKGRPA